MNNHINYIYICSAGHSGSTLLDMILGSHSKIESLGEIIQLSKNISLNTQCTCGVPVLSCVVWRKVVDILSDKLNIDIVSNPYALNMGFYNPQIITDNLHTTIRYKLKRIIFRGLRYLELKYQLSFLKPFISPIYVSLENTVLVYEAVRKVLQCQMVVDSSKSYQEAIGLYNKYPENTRILLLYRNGKGVLYSYIKRNFSRNKSINSWKNHYQRAIPLLKYYVAENHLFRIKYEQIVNDPTAQVKRICAFLDVEFESDMLNFTNHVHHITNGNNMRFSSSSEIRADNKWSDNLSEKDLAFFERKAGDLNRILGYV